RSIRRNSPTFTFGSAAPFTVTVAPAAHAGIRRERGNVAIRSGRTVSETVSRNGYSVCSSIRTLTPPPAVLPTSLGPYTPAARPPSLVDIHKFAASFGQR